MFQLVMSRTMCPCGKPPVAILMHRTRYPALCLVRSLLFCDHACEDICWWSAWSYVPMWYYRRIGIWPCMNSLPIACWRQPSLIWRRSEIDTRRVWVCQQEIWIWRRSDIDTRGSWVCQQKVLRKLTIWQMTPCRGETWANALLSLNTLVKKELEMWQQVNTGGWCVSDMCIYIYIDICIYIYTYYM